MYVLPCGCCRSGGALNPQVWKAARRAFQPRHVVLDNAHTRLLRVVDPGASVEGRGKRGQVSIDVAESWNFFQAHDNRRPCVLREEVLELPRVLGAGQAATCATQSTSPDA